MGGSEPWGWVVLSPWCPLYRRAQGTRRQETLFTVADVTTGILSYCSICHPVVLSSHQHPVATPSCHHRPCLVVLGQWFITRYEPGASQYRVMPQAEDTLVLDSPEEPKYCSLSAGDTPVEEDLTWSNLVSSEMPEK